MADGIGIWMPFYIRDYLADTGRLTTEQHGAYMLLIMDYWMSGPLPDDDLTLRQITKMSAESWATSGRILRGMFTRGADGRLFHKRIEKELEKARANKQIAVTRAKRAAEKRWSKDAPSNAPGNAPSIPDSPDSPENPMLGAMLEDVLEECPSPSPSQSPSPSASSSAKNVNGSGSNYIAQPKLGEIHALIERSFSFYCKSLDREPRRYTLTKARRDKASSRIYERLEINGGDLAIVEREINQCIQNLAASEWHRTNGHVDWINQVFRSAEEFEKRLCWQKQIGGSNGKRSFNRAQDAFDSTVAGGRAALESFGFNCDGVDEVGRDARRTDGLGRSTAPADGREPRRLTAGERPARDHDVGSRR